MLRTLLAGTVNTLSVTVIVSPITGTADTPVTVASFHGTDALPMALLLDDVRTNGFSTYTLLKQFSPAVPILNVVPRS